ncbi:hypothetical protein [Lederbergia lenta]|uniref:hypothetical protein n=1 Tax=Lederbergia lenta TaxID=1467 RepID=UPI00203BFC86|nr:hypothetical protein [Lederbergia lenta]MCM3113600.1 hypothetical protein [Lederbergia lenta]
MAKNAQSKILTIDEQIQKLKEKRNREVAKMERNAGKRLIERFNLENKSLDQIYDFIDTIDELTRDSLKEETTSALTDEQSNQ